jgi:DNA repair exonuclease SbcCD ATPase subunit
MRAIPENGSPIDLSSSSRIVAAFMATTSSLERINQLKAEIASLEQAAIQELMERRNNLSREMATVDAELAKLTGKPVEGKKPRAAGSSANGRNIPLQELKEELAAAPNKTLNIRKANLELRNIKVLAQANPGLLKLGGKGAWPTVTLLK